MEKTREPRQRSASLEQDARQPRLAIEADVTKDAKIRKRMEGAAAAERVIDGDNSFAQVNTDPIRLTSFGEDYTGPPPLPCTEYDVLIGNVAAAPKACLSPAEMRTPTVAHGLRPACTASTATRTTIHQPTSLVLPDRRCQFEDFKPIRLEPLQFLEDEGLANEIDANSGVRSWWL